MKTFTKLCTVVVLLLSSVAFAERYTLRVDGLACPYCAYGIEKKIKAIDGVQEDSIAVDLEKGRVVFIAQREERLRESYLAELINDAGFTLRALSVEASQ